MPRQMAMQRPHSRVVRDKVHDHVAGTLVRMAGLQDVRIATHRVVGPLRHAVPLAHALGHNPEIVPVEVHRVLAPVGHAVVVQDDSDRAVSAHVVGHSFWVLDVSWRVTIRLVLQEEDWVPERCVLVGCGASGVRMDDRMSRNGTHAKSARKVWLFTNHSLLPVELAANLMSSEMVVSGSGGGSIGYNGVVTESGT